MGLDPDEDDVLWIIKADTDGNLYHVTATQLGRYEPEKTARREIT